MSIDVTPIATPSLTERVAEEIRVVLTRRRLRQSHLARTMGVTEQWLSVRLRGVQPIDLNDLDRIAAALEVDVIDLMPREGRTLTTAYSVTPAVGAHAVDVRSPRPAGRSRFRQRAAA
jgi:transcriptional regulator with XRE-family HTH domain